MYSGRLTDGKKHSRSVEYYEDVRDDSCSQARKFLEERKHVPGYEVDFSDLLEQCGECDRTSPLIAEGIAEIVGGKE